MGKALSKVLSFEPCTAFCVQKLKLTNFGKEHGLRRAIREGGRVIGGQGEVCWEGERPEGIPGICLILCKMGIWKAAKDYIDVSCRPRKQLLVASNQSVRDAEPELKGPLEVTTFSRFGPETQKICAACSRSHISAWQCRADTPSQV